MGMRKIMDSMEYRQFWDGGAFVLVVMFFLAVNISVFYFYHHYLLFSIANSVLMLGLIGASITYLFFRKQNVFKKIAYILVLMAASGYTGMAMVHVGLMS